MKKISLLFTCFLTIGPFLYGQSLMDEVYNIFQNKCMNCHSNANQSGNLDLEGTGVNPSQIVRNKIAGKIPNNANAAALGDQIIYPGRPDKSFLFRKINQDFESTVSHDATLEGDAMPPNGQLELTNKEKELIRQWILFGAPVFNSQAGVPEDYVNEIPMMIENFYDVNGEASFPNGAPPTPEDEGKEGFQVKMGPFYMNPAGQNFSEMEFFQKYELNLPADVDVVQLDMKIATSSHHFVLYNFEGNGASTIPAGFRTNAFHNNIGIISGIQEATNLKLPEGTAFIWENDIVLDLNSHYINYSATNTYQSEVYINVYTQPSGTAAQEMFSDFFVRLDIPIANNGNEVVYEQHEVNNAPPIFVWGIMGHTHQWGTSYSTYLRNQDGSRGELIYDAACPQGVPGCATPFYDYQHIPIRYFDSLYELPMDPGFIHEAKWINNGPAPVNFGPTSDDEMMALVIMYTESLDGVVTNLSEPKGFEKELIKIYPNPMQEETTVVIPASMENVSFMLYTATGQEVHRIENITDSNFTFSKGKLNSGLYFFRVENEDGKFSTGKLFIE